jgi:hypothetical protein
LIGKRLDQNRKGDFVQKQHLLLLSLWLHQFLSKLNFKYRILQLGIQFEMVFTSLTVSQFRKEHLVAVFLLPQTLWRWCRAEHVLRRLWLKEGRPKRG